MNNKIKLAVAGAVLASASVANAGITWDAGEWTVDMNGNVNAFAIMTNAEDSNTINGGLATGKGNDDDTVGINTGLLPSWLGFTATTRQNDLDTSVTISFQPGAGNTTALAGGNSANAATENRQAFLTFGDKSWGSVKVGKDLGIFGSTAILNDMTLLGVGAGNSTVGNTTTLGRIGTGYVYADWIGQIAYTTPNMNGFQATLGITQPWHANTALSTSTVSSASTGSNDEFGFQGQGSFSWTGDFAGKVWAGFFSQNVENIADGGTGSSDTSTALEVGVSTSIYNINLVAYGYSGEGLGTTSLLGDAYDTTGNARDSDGGYVQATYVIPMGTKLGVSYGVSKLDDNTADAGALGQTLVEENSMLTVGAYHPLTKHLNLVAEYSHVEAEAHNGNSNENDVIALGAILFF
jgi:predicted porin